MFMHWRCCSWSTQTFLLELLTKVFLLSSAEIEKVSNTHFGWLFPNPDTVVQLTANNVALALPVALLAGRE